MAKKKSPSTVAAYASNNYNLDEQRAERPRSSSMASTPSELILFLIHHPA
jgi:hypothetical protein